MACITPFASPTATTPESPCSILPVDTLTSRAAAIIPAEAVAAADAAFAADASAASAAADKAYKKVKQERAASLIKVKEVEAAKIACDNHAAVVDRKLIAATYTVTSSELQLQSLRTRAAIAKEMAFDTAEALEVATSYVNSVCAKYRLVAINAMAKRHATAAAKAKADASAAALRGFKAAAAAAAAAVVADAVQVPLPTPIPMMSLTPAEPTEGPSCARTAKLVTPRRRMGDGFIPRADRTTPTAAGGANKTSIRTREAPSPPPSRQDADAHRTRSLDKLAPDAVFQGGRLARPPASDVRRFNTTGVATARRAFAATTRPTPAFFGEWLSDEERVLAGVVLPKSPADATRHVKGDRRPASPWL